LKEGLYSDFANRDTLLELVYFKSTKSDEYTSLADYKARMKPDQKAIYYITGTHESNLRNSPLLELYHKKDIEVLIMDDEIDEIIVPTIGKYKDVDLKAVNRSDAAEDLKSEEDKKSEKEIQSLIPRIKEILKDEVKDVKASARLSSSPSCLVADETDPTINMQHIMKALGQNAGSQAKPILEINPQHELVHRLNEAKEDKLIEDFSWVLYDQALLVEGVELKNPADFVSRLNRLLVKAL
jgi:molecular chaperone HtpG